MLGESLQLSDVGLISQVTIMAHVNKMFCPMGGLDPGHAGEIKSLSCMGMLQCHPRRAKRSGEKWGEEGLARKDMLDHTFEITYCIKCVLFHDKMLPFCHICHTHTQTRPNLLVIN